MFGCCGWKGRHVKRAGCKGGGWWWFALLAFAVVGLWRGAEKRWNQPLVTHEYHPLDFSGPNSLFAEDISRGRESKAKRAARDRGRDARRDHRRDTGGVLDGEKKTPDPFSWETVDHWPASIYAAAGEAWEGLGRVIVEQLDAICQTDEKAVEISIVEDRGHGAMQQIVTGTQRDRSGPLVKLLREAGCAVESDPHGDAAPADAERCAIQVVVGEVKDGVRQLRAELKHLQTDLREEAEVRFVEKPWVRQETFVKTGRAGREHWVIGRSGLEAEAKAAARAAREQAHREVAALLERAVRELSRLSPVEKIDLTDRIDETAARLVKEHLSDEFEQEVHGEFVDTNRCAVLVNLDGETLGAAAANLIRQQRVAKEGLLQRASAMGVMGVLIWLAYLFVNSGTRGHFVWKLRAGSVVGFAAVCLAIHYLQPF